MATHRNLLRTSTTHTTAVPSCSGYAAPYKSYASWDPVVLTITRVLMLCWWSPLMIVMAAQCSPHGGLRVFVVGVVSGRRTYVE